MSTRRYISRSSRCTCRTAASPGFNCSSAACSAATLTTGVRLTVKMTSPGFSPFADPTRCLARRNQVLRRMEEEQFITPQESQDAQARPLVLQGQPTPDRSVAPYFIDEVATPDTSTRWPRPGLTVLQFPNNHLAYAITWFVLAAMMVAAFVYVRKGADLVVETLAADDTLRMPEIGIEVPMAEFYVGVDVSNEAAAQAE